MIKNNLLPKKEINILFSNVELIYGVNQVKYYFEIFK